MSDPAFIPPPQIPHDDDIPPVADLGHDHRLRVAAEIERIHGQQNLAMAILGGVVASIVGAVLWAVITAVTQFQIGFMAIGVGFLVGWAVWNLGHGVTTLYGVIGGLFALFGCLLGNLLTFCYFAGQEAGMPVLDVLNSVLASGSIVGVLTETFSPMDLLFYAIAVYEGYKLSFRELIIG